MVPGPNTASMSRFPVNVTEPIIRVCLVDITNCRSQSLIHSDTGDYTCALLSHTDTSLWGAPLTPSALSSAPIALFGHAMAVLNVTTTLR